MGRATTLRNTVTVTAPFLYAAGFVLVMSGDVAVISFVERTIGFWNDKRGLQPADLITLPYNGDVVAAAATLVIGGVVFGVLASVLLRLERLHGPAIGDHLRHCTALYVILATLMVLLLATYEKAAHGMSLGYGVAVVAFFTIGYAILIDASVLWWQRRKYVQASSGDSA